MRQLLGWVGFVIGWGLAFSAVFLFAQWVLFGKAHIY